MLSGMSGPVEGPPAQAFMPPGGGLKPKASAHMEEVAVERVPVLAMVTSLFPLFLPFSCYVVQPSTHAAVLHCGTLTKMQTRAGLHCTFPSGKYVMSVSVKQQTLSLPDSKITDSRGSPILVSAIVNYRVLDAKKALFAVEDYRQYIETNATSVLKQVVGTHTYDGLKSNAAEVNAGMMEEVQKQVSVAGILVLSMSLNELNYAPEIASVMLRKQQAGALVEARELIVEGAVKIAQDAIRRLEQGGTITMNDSEKVKIVTNLLTVTCSESQATPAVVM
ncbi:unnamed protein product [Polarella glacialis]|uniref:Band 7 domain-containing protein n=1 Tax=Polarella glacialis TaxID=89957 RepID=A0A813LT07_POLGL|nr:unnamed protein product [Polarella glacialis]